MSREHINFETKKSLHISLTRETHAAFRMLTFQYHLSMQEVFEEVCQRIVSEDPTIIKMLNQLQEDKKNKTIKKLSKEDV